MSAQPAIDYSGFIRQQQDGRNCLRVVVDGMHCAGCAFKIEKALNAEDSVEARINVTEKRLTLFWPGEPARGNALLEKAAALGFRFSPLREKSDEEKQHLRSLQRAMAVAGFAAGNLMIFSFALWFSTRQSMGGGTRDLMHWFSALLALPTVIYAGTPFFSSAWRALRGGHTNMDVPISVALLLTTGMSLIETIRGGDYVYFDSAVMLLFLLLVGRYLDAKARAQTRSAAADLLSLMSGTATIIEGDKTSRIPADDVHPGMALLVAMGEKIMADGICDKDAQVDTSALTGETLPQHIPAGGRLLAGMVNLGDALRLHVEKAQSDSLMNDIITLMQRAEQGNATYVRLADRIAGWYTPVVHALALTTFLGWWQLGHASWQQALVYAITVLVITCPCALGLAVPVAQVVAGSRLFRSGMLLKSGDALERLAAIDTVIFDKTGTLTTGEIVFENKDDFSDDDRALISSLAAASRHPLAQVAARSSLRRAALDAKEHPGQGMSAFYQGRDIRLGSAAFTGAAKASEDKNMELWFKDGDREPRRLVFSDKPHADAVQTISTLQKKYRVMLLSGDRPAAAAHIAQMTGITEYRGGVDPKQKFTLIEQEQEKGRHILMVGDGLNDAAALARADVSMSPSSAVDITQTAADIVYQQKGLSSVLKAIETAKSTQSVVRQNLFMALAYNAVAIPLAMCGLVTPLIAAAAMSASSLAVILNALRLKG